MIDRKQFDTRVEALEQSLQSKLNLRGKSLHARLKRAGRLLPKRLRGDGLVLVEAQDKLTHPKLAVQVDENRVKNAFDAFEAHLKTVDPADRRKGKLLGWLAGLVLNLIVLTAIFLFALYWQDLI